MQQRKILTYQELFDIPLGENKESLVDVRIYDQSIIARYEKLDMISYIGTDILVRDTVAKKLANANATLSKKYGYCLKVVYGYRHPDIQKTYFDKQRAEIKKNNQSLSEEKLDALTHNFVAVPVVAGHPTGAAVDVTIVDTSGNNADMGTKIADFSSPEKIKTFAENLSDAQKKNRKLLHDVLINAGFAPFYGEWWHFSYGDREWACFYKKPSSLYSSIQYDKKKATREISSGDQ